MKTFNDLEVGDYFFDLDVKSSKVYRNKIKRIDSSQYGKVLVWTDNNNCPGETLILHNELNLTVSSASSFISCVSSYDIINILCNS